MLHDDYAVSVNIPVPSRNWELIIKPIALATNTIIMIYIVNVALSLLLSLLIYQSLSSRQNTVEKKKVENDLKSSKSQLELETLQRKNAEKNYWFRTIDSI